MTAGFPIVGRAFKVPELYAEKLARTVLRGRKLPGSFMHVLGINILLNLKSPFK